MVINGIIDLDNGELLEATGKHRISALDIQGSETAELKLTFYKNGSAVTDNSVVSGAVIDFGVKADADYTGTSYLIYHDTFSASTDGLEYSGTPTWATAEVETALGNESSVKLHGQVKVVISGVTYYSQVFEVEIHNNVIQAAGTTNSVIYPRLIQSESDPTVNDDSLDGYGVSSLWLNTSSNAVHVLMDNTAGAAVWAGFLGLTNGQLANNLVFNDDLKAVFGTNSDGLEIYHNGSNSYIDDTGTGDLILRANDQLKIQGYSNSHNMAVFNKAGSVALFYNNEKKLETTDLGATVSGKLIVSGDLDVDGTTTTFNSTVVTVDDPVFGIGGDTAPESQDNKDRGVSFRYHDGTSAKVGFYGWDNSENAFTFLTDTNDDSTEVFSGTLADLKCGNILLADDKKINFGDNSEYRIDYDSSGYAYHQNTSGATYFVNSANDKDFIFQTTSSDTTAAILRLDASSGYVSVGPNTPNYYFSVKSDGADIEIYDQNSNGNARLFVRAGGTTGNSQIFFGDDADVDIGKIRYRHSSNSLAFETNGTEAARFDASGCFGINKTSNLKGKLDVGGVSYFNGGSTSGHTQDETDAALVLQDNFYIYSENGGGYLRNIIGKASTGPIILGEGGTSIINEIRSYAGEAGLYTWHKGTTETMRLNSTGLGIGGSPSAKLDVQLEAGAWNVGSSFTNKAVRISGGSGGLGLAYDDTTGGTIAAIHHGNSWKSLNFGAVQYIFDINGSEVMRLNSTGLGIGGSPSAKLDVQLEAGAWNVGSSFTNKAVRISGGSGGLGLAYDDTTGGTIAAIHHGNSWKSLNFGAVQYIFDINGSEVMRLNSTGLGIGGSPNELLQIDGTSPKIRLRDTDASGTPYVHFDASDGNILLSADAGDEIASSNIQFAVDGTEAARFDSDGHLLVNTTTSSSDVLQSVATDARYAGRFTGSEISGSSFGLRVRAGYTSSDNVLLIEDRGGTDLFKITGDGSINVPDDVMVKVGSGGDLEFRHDGTNSSIKNHTGDLVIEQNADDKDIIFKSDNGSGGTETYFRLDGSASSGNPITVFPDNSKLTFGDSYDLRVFHDGNNKIESHGSSDLYFKQQGTDRDFIFEVKPSGVSTEILRLDGSTGNVGIGCTPSTFLHVSKDNSNSGNQFCVADTEGATAAIRTYATSHPQGLIINHYYAEGGSGNEYARYADFVSNVGSGAATKIRFITKNAANNYFTTIIDNEGRMGIGGDPSENADLTLGGGELCMAETTTPTADANFGKIYCKSDNKLYFQDGAGTEHEIAFV